MIYHGVDFSGARRAREKIWVAALEESEGQAGAYLPARVEGGLDHEDLVERIAHSARDGRRHAWLIDCAFGLPVELLEQHGIERRWSAAAEWLASFPNARAWRGACRKRSRKELKRLTDRVAKTPFAPTNLRMFRQTWHLIVSVLKPLSTERDIALWPLDLGWHPSESRSAPVWVGEGCPSSLLRAAGLPYRGYKGRTEANRARREEIVRWLEGRSEPEGAKPIGEPIPLDPAARELAIDVAGGDPLDALILLPAARRFAASEPWAILAQEPRASVEGWVYL